MGPVESVEVEAPEESGKLIDLMAALKKSLDNGAAAKTPAKKAAPKKAAPAKKRA